MELKEKYSFGDQLNKQQVETIIREIDGGINLQEFSKSGKAKGLVKTLED
jgi:hypothetical protein